MSVHVIQMDIEKCPSLESFLLENGFSHKRKISHVLFSLEKEGISCTLYESGKCVIQGKELHFQEFIEFILEPFLGDFSYSSSKILDLSKRIGTDEAGKGDLFGPLCVGAVYLDPSSEKKLRELGVRDSKKLSDQRVISLSRIICSCCLFKVLRLVPSTYNRLYKKFGNLNHLLGWAHARVVSDLLQETQKPDKVIVDQFAKDPDLIKNAFVKAGIDLHLEQRFRAEEDCAVAAASILARAAFLNWLKEASEKTGIHLHKGSGESAQESLKLILEHCGECMLSDVAKIHFKQIKEAVR